MRLYNNIDFEFEEIAILTYKFVYSFGPPIFVWFCSLVLQRSSGKVQETPTTPAIAPFSNLAEKLNQERKSKENESKVK